MVKKVLAVGLLIGFVLTLVRVSPGIEKRIRSGVKRPPVAAAPKVRTPKPQPVSILGMIPASRRRPCGLHRLTAGQRVALDAELAKVMAALTYQATATPSIAPPAPAPALPSGRLPIAPAGAIESTVRGKFRGWRHGTIIELMNGQIWQQVEYYIWIHYAYMPSVLLYPSLGGWKMRVEGVDYAVRVKRLK